MAWRGLAGQGRARLGKVRRGDNVHLRINTIFIAMGPGMAGPGMAWRGLAGHGAVWPGKARQGVGANGSFTNQYDLRPGAAGRG